MILGLAAFLAAVAWYEWPRIERFGGGKGEKAAFAFFMVMAFALSAAHVLGLPVPNPTDVLQAVFGPLVPWRY